MRRGRHSRTIPQAPPCGLRFFGKWLMSYDLKPNLGPKPTNRPLGGLKEFSTTIAIDINDLPATTRTEVTSDTMHKSKDLHLILTRTRHSNGTPQHGFATSLGKGI